MFFFFSGANAQKALSLNEHLTVKYTDKVLYGDPAAEKPVGTPYLNENFITGIVHANNANYTDVFMRYNIYDDNIEFKQDNKLFILDPQPRINKVELDGVTFVVEGYEYKGKVRLGYFELLDSGSVTLIAKKVVTYREQQAPRALEIGPTPARYTKAPDIYYYKIRNGQLTQLENVKKMIASFPDKQSELTEFAKKEKTSSNNKAELIKLVRFYNSQ